MINLNPLMVKSITKPLLSRNQHVFRLHGTGRKFSTFQTVADMFMTLHETSGIPWIILIPTTTFALRTIFTFPLSVFQRKRTVKQQELRKVVQSMTPVIKLRLAAAKIGESQTPSTIEASKEKVPDLLQKETIKQLTQEQIIVVAAKETRRRQKALFQTYKVQVWKNVLLPVVQVPLWCTVSMGIRKLTEWKIEGSSHAWFESFRFLDIDLTGPLEIYPMVLPITLGIVSILNVEYNGNMMLRKTTDVVGIQTYQDDNSRLTQGIKSVLNVSRIGCVFMMGVSSQASILLSLYWISSNAYSLIQNILLDFLWPYQK